MTPVRRSAFGVRRSEFGSDDDDSDGICSVVDSCVTDPLNDDDSDDICDGLDSCLADSENDGDSDSFCDGTEVDCVGNFDNWSVCDATCDGGTTSRTFTITTFAAAGGDNCLYTDGSVETEACATTCCDSDSDSEREPVPLSQAHIARIKRVAQRNPSQACQLHFALNLDLLDEQDTHATQSNENDTTTSSSCCGKSSSRTGASWQRRVQAAGIGRTPLAYFKTATALLRQRQIDDANASTSTPNSPTTVETTTDFADQF